MIDEIITNLKEDKMVRLAIIALVFSASLYLAMAAGNQALDIKDRISQNNANALTMMDR